MKAALSVCGRDVDADDRYAFQDQIRQIIKTSPANHAPTNASYSKFPTPYDLVYRDATSAGSKKPAAYQIACIGKSSSFSLRKVISIDVSRCGFPFSSSLLKAFNVLSTDSTEAENFNKFATVFSL